MSNPRKELYELAKRLDKEARLDPRDAKGYENLMDELLYHAAMRFGDYITGSEDQGFPARLKRWFDNVKSDRHKQALLLIFKYLLFIDRPQMLSLHRDAFHRVITPWLTRNHSSTTEMLSPSFGETVLSLMQDCETFCLTESFNFSDFQSINTLTGLSHPTVLSVEPTICRATLSAMSLASVKAAIVLEDFVGTGRQALRTLRVLREMLRTDVAILFVPLIILEDGLRLISGDAELRNVYVHPVIQIPVNHCVRESAVPKEPAEFAEIRALVKLTGPRVIRRLNPLDDPPSNPFGFGKCGGLVVTYHNCSNNTLPLIHHKAPNWDPVFRRVHHSRRVR